MWLIPAYYLEYKGMNNFFYVWAGSVVFFVVNILILNQLVGHYKKKTLSKKEE